MAEVTGSSGLGGAASSSSFGAASVGSVPCSFRLLVHEATQVPYDCQSLSVRWRKGGKVVSTGIATVQEARAEWERPITVSCVLFRGPTQFEQKLCWLEVARDDDAVLGHAQLDLARFCDGQIHTQVLQVWKRETNSSMDGLKLRVSIEACSSGRVGSVPLLTVPEVRANPESAAAFPVPREVVAAAPQMEDLQTFLRTNTQLSPTASSPLEVNFNMQHQQQDVRQYPRYHPHPVGAGGSPNGGSLPLGEPTSRYGTTLNSLPDRLVALCRRQCLTSDLTSVQQEDAVQLFMASLRQSREPLQSCGVLFSSSPPRVRDTLSPRRMLSPKTRSVPLAASGDPFRGILSLPLDVLATGTVGSAQMNSIEAAITSHRGSDTANAGVSGVFTPPPIDYSQNSQLVSEGAVPSALAGSSMADLTVGSDVAHASGGTHLPSFPVVDTSNGTIGAPHSCTKDLYELLSHLSDIRSLAMMLSPLFVFTADIASDAQANNDGYSFTNPIVSSDGAVPENVGGGEERVEQPDVDQRWDEIPRVGAMPEESSSGIVSSSPIPPQVAHEIVSQLLQGANQATAIGESALKEVATAFDDMIMQLHEVSRDRELWVHRFLAARELQYSNDLCERVAHGEFAIPAVA